MLVSYLTEGFEPKTQRKSKVDHDYCMLLQLTLPTTLSKPLPASQRVERLRERK
jgi:hypothetical protein